MELNGKNVFVTGSTRGIGQAIALAFAKAGANIILNGRSEIRPEQIQAIEALGVQCIGISGDISNFEAAGKMIDDTVAALGSIDILVNNAGITKDTLLLRMSKEDFEACLSINLTGTFNMTQHAVKRMMKQRSGRIINLASVSGLIGNVGQANYAASKAGLLSLARTLSAELLPRGIRINGLSPGPVDTPALNKLGLKEDALKKMQDSIAKLVPLGRMGTTTELAKAALYLASDESSYTVGTELLVDGGTGSL